MEGEMRKNRFYFRMAFMPLLILLVIFFLPLCFNLSRAFFTDEGFTFDLLKEVFFDRYTYRILIFTLLQASISSLVSVLVALPGSWLYANFRFRFKSFFLSLSTLCFVLPSILVVLGFVIFYGNSGFVNDLYRLVTGSDGSVKFLYSFRAIIMAHAFLNIPIALNLISSAWAHYPANEEKASRMLGASALRTFTKITFPRLRGTILSAFLLIFLFCFTSFSIILVLGGGPEYTTLEVEIYRTNNIALDSARASSLSIFSFLANLVILAIYLHFSKTEESREKSNSDRAVLIKSTGIKIFLFIYNILLLVFFLGPLLSIPARSFWSTSKRYGEGFSLKSYEELFGMRSSIGMMSDALTALFNSIVIALVTGLVAVMLSLFLSLYVSKKKSRIAETFSMLPLAVSSVTLGLGYYIIKAHLHSSSLLVSYALVILAHLVIALPFSMRTVTPVAKNINHRITDSAAMLGSADWRTCFFVEIPMLSSVLGKAFIFSFALSMGEANATLTLSEGRVITLPILLYRLINSYNYQGACAVGTLLIVSSLIVFLVSHLVTGREKDNA